MGIVRLVLPAHRHEFQARSLHGHPLLQRRGATHAAESPVRAAGRTIDGGVQMKELVWLDLCSGLGGASQPALDRGWKVIRVDIDPRFRPDIVADVRDLSLKFSFRPDVLWASPPCQDFAKWGMRNWYPNPPDPDLSCCQGVSQTIAMM